MIAANDNRPAYASNGVSIARLSFMPERPAPARDDVPDDAEPDPIGNVPLADLFARGLFNDEQGLAVAWWVRQATAYQVSYGAGMMAAAGGVHQPFVSRPPDALWGPEEAIDRRAASARVLRLLRLGSSSNGLADAIDAAVFMRADMSSLAPPRLVFPAKKRALAGRIRLGAGLNIVARFIGPGCTITEAREIAEAAADACLALVATRRLRADNDNAPAARRLAA